MENDLKNQIQQGIKDYMSDSQYGVSKISSHLHNGVDTSRINEKDIVRSPGYGAFFQEAATETFKIQNVPNVRRLTFSGFAANNADASPATKRAIVNGEVLFGKFYTYTGSGQVISVSSTNNQTFQYIQSGNSMYVDSTDLTKNRVTASQGLSNATDGGFVLVADNTGATVASMKVDSYDGSTITISSIVGTNWLIQGLLVLT